MKFFWLLLIVMLSAACTATPAPVNVDGPVVPQNSDGTTESYPAPQDIGAAPATAYPMGSEVEPTLASTATINPSLGIVKGVLLVQGKPVVGADIYIADLLQSDEGKDIAYAFSQGTSPRSATNERGEFEFRNVPHGTHSLILDTMIQSYLLLKPNTQEAMKIDTGTGTVIDLGVLDYDELPFP